MNNKGFMMAEVIVVASIIMLSLTGFYSLYTNAISVYNTRIDYNDVGTLYELANFRDNSEIRFTPHNHSVLKLADYDEFGFQVYLVRNYATLDNIESRYSDINQTLKDYLEYLIKTIEPKTIAVSDYWVSHFLIMEKCEKDGEGKYRLDCKYAYLETAVK